MYTHALYILGLEHELMTDRLENVEGSYELRSWCLGGSMPVVSCSKPNAIRLVIIMASRCRMIPNPYSSMKANRQQVH
jgi:hypothetical protein